MNIKHILGVTVLALLAITVLLFAGATLITGEKVSYTGNQNDAVLNDVVSDTGRISDRKTFLVNETLKRYLTARSEFTDKYSGLTPADLREIDSVVNLASQKVVFSDTQKRTSKATYQKFFSESALSSANRVEDAPSARANELIRTKLCIALAIITETESEVVRDCSNFNSVYPDAVEWETDDITAEAQIAPFYVAGLYYVSQDADTDQAEYCFMQVRNHFETAKKQWGDEYFESVAGESYLKMVEDSVQRVDALPTGP